MAYIKVDSVWKIYRLGYKSIYALRGVSLNIGRGECICILGPNGSGKTTLLKIIAGYIYPSSGSVYINGVDITKLNYGELARFRRENIGFIFQEDILIDSLTVLENLELAIRHIIRDRVERFRRISAALDLLGIGGLKHRLYGKLSMGERRRVSISLAMVNRPRILLADEPTSNLDEEAIHDVIGTLKELNRDGVTLIISTHDPLVSSQFRGKVYLRQGKIMGRNI